MKIIDRYLIKEFLSPFSLSLAALLLLLLTQQMLRLTELLVEKGVDPLTLLKIFTFLLPSFLVVTMPIAVLVASISAFNRLSEDSEVIAFKAAGISFYRLLRPIFFLSLIVCILVYIMSISAKPWSGASLKDLAVKLLKQQVSIALQEGAFNQFSRSMLVFIDKMPTSNDLEGILIYDQSRPDQPHLIVAQKGAIRSDPTSDTLFLHLLSGSVHLKGKEPDQHQRIYFSSYDVRFDLSTLLIGAASLSESRLTVQEIKARLREAGEDETKWLRELQQYYRNYALPLASLIFGILGVSLGIHTKRAGRLGGFSIGVLVVGVYYLLMVSGDFLVTTRWLPPLAAAWFPNLVLGAGALFITLHSAARK